MRGTDVRAFSLDSESGELSDADGTCIARLNLETEGGRMLAALILQYPFVVGSLDELREWNDWSYLGDDEVLVGILRRARSLSEPS